VSIRADDTAATARAIKAIDEHAAAASRASRPQPKAKDKTHASDEEISVTLNNVTDETAVIIVESDRKIEGAASDIICETLGVRIGVNAKMLSWSENSWRLAVPAAVAKKWRQASMGRFVSVYAEIFRAEWDVTADIANPFDDNWDPASIPAATPAGTEVVDVDDEDEVIEDENNSDGQAAPQQALQTSE
jgi:hypothetical protein